MNTISRIWLFVCGFCLFVSASLLLFIDPVTEFMWKIHCMRVDNKFERMVSQYMKDTGWKIRYDKTIRGWMCISRSGFRITLKNACEYIRNHNDPNDRYYWVDDFRMWNYVRKDDMK